MIIDMKKEPYLIPEAVCMLLQTAFPILVEASGADFTDVTEEDWTV